MGQSKFNGEHSKFFLFLPPFSSNGIKGSTVSGILSWEIIILFRSLNKILSYKHCSDYSWNKISFRQRSWCHCSWGLWLVTYLQNAMERWIWNAAVRSDNTQHTHLTSTQSWDEAPLLPSPAAGVWGSRFLQERPTAPLRTVHYLALLAFYRPPNTFACNFLSWHLKCT